MKPRSPWHTPGQWCHTVLVITLFATVLTQERDARVLKNDLDKAVIGLLWEETASTGKTLCG